MYDVESSEWRQREKREISGTEENLLYKYCCKFGGVTFTEVLLKDEKEPTNKARRVDAVRFPRRRDRPKPEMVSYKEKEFHGRLSRASKKKQEVQDIEVKKALNRSVIGQVIVAKYLLLLEDKKLQVRPRMVVICGSSNVKRLKDFCRKFHSRVWNPHKMKFKQRTAAN